MRGTGQGERGPDADKGSYDSLAYWCRAGVAIGVKQHEDDVPPPPAPAFGDSIGAMTIAGGIMGALFHRERTGEATTVDVSLLGTGLWSMGAALALSLQLQRAVGGRRPAGQADRQPARRQLPHQGRPVRVAVLPAGRPSTGPRPATIVGRPELATDERFADAASISANALGAARAAGRGVRRAHRSTSGASGSADFSGQWAVVQDTLEAAADPQTVANGYVQDCETADGVAVPARRRAGAVRRASRPSPTRAPGVQRARRRDPRRASASTWDPIIDLKVRGVVA